MIKKGAMFGLDARIALAIFGALSVISGAALYSAIQEAKVTALFTEMSEIEKALESHYLDTGSVPKKSGSNPTADLDLSQLVVNNDGAINWKGPYLSLEAKVDGLASEKCTSLTLPYRSVDDASVNCTSALKKCRLYIYCLNSDTQLNKALEERIDGAVPTSTEYNGKINYRGGDFFYVTNIVIDFPA